MNTINWKQFSILIDTKANIEALSGVAEGTPAYALDTNEPGNYNGSTWDWFTGSSFDLAAAIHAAASDSSFHDDDEFSKSDSQDGWGLKKFTWANLKTALDTLYQTDNSELQDIIDAGAGASEGAVIIRASGHWISQTLLAFYGNLKSTYLDSDFADLFHTHSASDITSGTLSNDRLDADLKAIGNLSPSNDDIIQRKSGAWTNRTMAQLLLDLAIRFCLPFSSYTSLGSPISASPSFPYAATLPSFAIYPKQWSQGFFIGATNNGSNYWTFDLLYNLSGVMTVAASVNTSGVSANTTVVLTTTTFDRSSYSQSHIRFAVRATKTGSPSDISAHGPALEYGLA